MFTLLSLPGTSAWQPRAMSRTPSAPHRVRSNRWNADAAPWPLPYRLRHSSETSGAVSAPATSSSVRPAAWASGGGPAAAAAAVATVGEEGSGGVAPPPRIKRLPCGWAVAMGLRNGTGQGEASVTGGADGAIVDGEAQEGHAQMSAMAQQYTVVTVVNR